MANKIYLDIPTICPVCGQPLAQVTEAESTVLMCQNADCSSRLINRIEHFASIKGLDIKGISKATLEKLIEWGWLDSYVDLFELHNYRNEWIKKPGFGAKSVDKILNSIDAARDNVKPESFLAAIGIPFVGRSLSQEICKAMTYDEFREYVNTKYDFTTIEGIATEKQNYIYNFDFREADAARAYVRSWARVEVSETPGAHPLNGKTLVITGTLTHFKNRAELVAAIQKAGGKVTSSVSSNTSYLICNDKTSATGKSKDAQRLSIPIVNEEEILTMLS